jgi:hypothetical protein
MKTKFIYCTIFFTVLLFFFKLNAQDCYYYHEYQCKFPNTTYYISGQSRSALFTYGMTSEFKIVTFGGEDYHISICHQFKLKNVRFRLIEDNEDKTVLFDNAENKYTTEVTFTNNTARKIFIEVSIPDDAAIKDKSVNQCVGVLIHSRRTYQEPKNKMGF